MYSPRCSSLPLRLTTVTLPQGPAALKKELKRQRLAALTAATMASFKTSRTEGNTSVDTDTSRRVRDASEDGTTTDEDRHQEQYRERGGVMGATFADQPQQTSYLHQLAGHKSLDLGLPCGGLASSTNISSSGDQIGPETRCRNSGSSDHEDFRLSCPTTSTTVPSERRDTFTLATSTDDELFGTGATVTSKLPSRSPDPTTGICCNLSDDIRQDQRKVEAGMGDRKQDSGVGRDSRANLPSSVRVTDGLKRGSGRRYDNSERVWRASLAGSPLRRPNSSDSTDTHDRESVNLMSSTVQSVAWPSAWVNSSSALTEDVDEITVGGREEGPGNDGAENTLALKNPSRHLEKLPGEDIASMLLSDHNFVSSKLSAANVLERAQLLEKPPTQPYPDLPYGFTDLGKRVNVEHSQHGGGGAQAPNIDVVVGRERSEGEVLEKET